MSMVQNLILALTCITWDYWPCIKTIFHRLFNISSAISNWLGQPMRKQPHITFLSDWPLSLVEQINLNEPPNYTAQRRKQKFVFQHLTVPGLTD